MKYFYILLIIIVFGCANKEDNNLPNIVYILADDLGYGDVSVYNSESKVSTPNIDKLASQGMRFTDAHSPSSVCTPTRYGILTGRYCWRSRLPKGFLLGYGQSLIKDEETTVAELLKNSGYTTGVVGKWHLGLDWKIKEDYQDSLLIYQDESILANIKSDWIDFEKPPTNGPLAHGFDYSYILPASLDMDPYCYLENDTLTEPVDRFTPGSQPSGYTGAFWRAGRTSESFDFFEVLPNFIAKASGFVRSNTKNDKPFFLYLALAAPHTPWMPKEEYKGQSGAGEYGDFVQMVDAAVGEFLETLDELGISGNTIVMFTSDNGPYWRPEFIERYNHRAAFIYKGMKADAWDGGHRVPFIVRWPGKVGANSQSNQLTTHTNLIATLADITNQEMDASTGMDSRSILSALLEGEINNDIPVIHHSSRGVFAIRQGDWKYIDGLGSGGFSTPAIIQPEAGGPTGQLYNMKDDPGELNNLFFDHPEKMEELKSELEEIKNK